MPEKTGSARGRMDQQLAQAVDFARENAVEVGGEASVGAVSYTHLIDVHNRWSAGERCHSAQWGRGASGEPG